MCENSIMFGRGKRSEEELRNGGKHAPADILEAEQGVGITVGNPALAANTEIVYKLRLRVRPEGEAPFEVALKARFPQFSAPRRGASIGVIYDPADHSKVVIDESAAGAAQSAISAALGGSPAVAANPRMGGSISDLMQSALADPMAFQRRMQQQAAAGIDPLTGRPVSYATPGAPSAPTAPAAPPAVDPIEQLTKLADLRDRGVLTDEEFEAQKRRLLGS